MPRRKLLFVSYSRKDKHIVGPISELLRAGGVAVFRDETGLKPGDHWSAIITEKLEEAATVFVFWSENAAKSTPVTEEWTRAIQRAIKVVPVLLDGTPLAEPLRQFHWQDMRGMTLQSIKLNEAKLKVEFASWLFGPAIRLSESALSSVSKVMGLGSAYAAEFLAGFVSRFDNKLEAIPQEIRVPPPTRLGCAVLREAAYAADESDLQEMFASLLAAGCNAETQHLAHPGFVDVISQLISLDAEILKEFSDPTPTHGIETLLPKFNPELNGEKNRQFGTSIGNLLRLGLLEWVTKEISGHQSYHLRPTRGNYEIVFHATDPSKSSQILQNQLTTLSRNFDQFAVDISRLLANVGERSTLRRTSFGQQFLSACMPSPVVCQGDQVSGDEVSDNA